MTPEHLCALVADACDLLERGAALEVCDGDLIADALALATDLRAGAAGVDDDAVADDAAVVATALEDLAHRVDTLPERLLRRTA